NDTLNGAPATLATVTISQVSTSNPNVTINPATGAVNVAPGTPAGTYTLVYQICEQLNPTNCDTATVTVTVGAAVIDAVDDTGTVANGAAGGTAVPNVLVNDTLNGAPATLATVTISQVSTSNPNVTINPATGAVNVAPGTPAGTYTLVYQICEQLNPSNCDTATVTVTVGAAVIDAVDDTGTVANGAAGGTAVPNVLVNDTLNGAPATLATVTISQVSTSNPNVTINPATGAVNVAPGTPAGTFTLVYQICEQLNPTNCDTATVTVTVGAAVIDAVDDTFPPVSGVGGGTTGSVLGNDTLNGVAVTPADITLTPGVAPTPATGSITMNPDGTITIAAGTEAGTYTYPYTICEALNPANCDTAVATVIVSAQPGLTLDKIAGTPTANVAGATIAYSFVVTNTGNVTVTGLAINDAKLDAAAVCPATTLAPGASTTCTGTHTITQAEVDAGTVDNTATATGTLPGNGGTTVSPPDSTSTPIAQTPAISATKTATLTTDNGVPALADEGDVITYAVSVTNTGNVTLNNLVVSDSFEGGTPTTLTCTPTTLVPGATATCASYTHTVTAAEALAGGTLDNVATARALSSTSAQTVTSTSTAVVAVNGAPATIRVTKTASPRDVHVGDLVRYTVTMENTSQTTMTDGTLVDTPPAGFVYVDGSLQVVDADNAGRLVGTNPIRVDQIDIAGGDRATVTYLLRVGAGVRAGIHTNSALVEDNGDVVSNTATADVQLVADPMLDDSLILGTVFNDRDGDGWQDPAGLGDVRVQGGFAAEAYVPNSTTVDRGAGPKPEADHSSPMLHGIAVGDLTARQSEGDAVANHTVVVRQKLRELRFTDDFVLTSAQGVTVRMAADGSTRVEKSGDAAKGLNAAEPTVERRVSQVADGYVVDYVIANAGIDERGIPGVRLATVEGLLVETDQYGRYHLAGVDGGRSERGRNLILKVDPATLPPGTVFTTDNPLVKRVTPGVPTRFDFGVKLPVSVLEGATQAVEMELGSVMFAPDSAEIRPQYRAAIDKIADASQGHAGGEIVIGAEGGSDLLAFERAIAVRDALVAKLSPETAAGLRISVRANPHDPDSTVVGVMEWPLIGTFLFETDRAEIKPEYRPLVRRIADYLVAIGTTRVAVVGHADKRGADDYNVALGMRRAKAVYDAIAEALPANVRGGLRVDINEDPAAPAGMNGQ
ncbi:MAG: OmpA family protein, partial [Xanthomonadales bacterium]|nr:OmpA family protein [Xanthomonadales bacterium]